MSTSALRLLDPELQVGEVLQVGLPDHGDGLHGVPPT
jgi:hypothetical protein